MADILGFVRLSLFKRAETGTRAEKKKKKKKRKKGEERDLSPLPRPPFLLLSSQYPGGQKTTNAQNLNRETIAT